MKVTRVKLAAFAHLQNSARCFFTVQDLGLLVDRGLVSLKGVFRECDSGTWISRAREPRTSANRTARSGISRTLGRLSLTRGPQPQLCAHGRPGAVAVPGCHAPLLELILLSTRAPLHPHPVSLEGADERTQGLRPHGDFSGGPSRGQA